MENALDTRSVTTNNHSDTNSVTPTLLNTHCIVCGKAFQVARMSKLYCSARCKQFGYNHKTEITQALASRQKGINPKPMIFLIDDFTLYDKIQKRIKRFRELAKKRFTWESIDQEIRLRQKIDLPVNDYLWNSYISKKLTENEENELSNNENELEEHVIDLDLKELSLEQWSFIKSLHETLDELAFLRFVSSLSKEFLGQLNYSEKTTSGNNEYLVIKNKFVNHCNLIATGIIKFEKKEQTKED